MSASDLFRFASDSLLRRRGRTILTVIGVVVGVCAIVVMVSLGIAVNRATDAMLQNWGDLTKIQVYRYGAQQGTPDLDDKAVERFRALPHVAAATPMYQPPFWGIVEAGKSGRYVADGVSITGIDPGAVEPMGYKLLTGGYGLSESVGTKKIPVLVGNQVPFLFRDARKSMNAPNAMKYPQYDDSYSKIINLPQYGADGKLQNPDEFFFDVMQTKLVYRVNTGYDTASNEPKYMDYELVPVGVIDVGMNDWAVSNGILMSVENLKKIEAAYNKASGNGPSRGGGMEFVVDGKGGSSTVTVKGYDTVYVKVDKVENMGDIEKELKSIGYQISSMSDTRAQMQGQVAQTQMMLGGLATVSLFVAALNIMNTMTMAITERTREIGVMKVLGCSLRNIRQLFLIESGAIGLIGGVFGVAVSFLLSLLLNHLTTILSALGIAGSFDIAASFGLSGLTQMMPGMKLSVIPPWLILLALAFATAVGLLSGIAPSNRAVRISSLEAIRHE